MEPSLSLHSVKEMFDINAEVLAALVDPKNPEALQKMGGIKGLAESLHVDLQKGLPDTFIPDAGDIETQRIEKYPLYAPISPITSNLTAVYFACTHYLFHYTITSHAQHHRNRK
jgi:hypothetical protein